VDVKPHLLLLVGLALLLLAAGGWLVQTLRAPER
jgi:hypothetical protein